MNLLKRKRNLPHLELAGSRYFITFRCAKDVRLNDREKELVMNAVKYNAGKQYMIYCGVVMPDHVHFILEPIEDINGKYFSLSQIMHSLKSYTAHEINKLRQRKGSIWQDESYDRIVRDDRELQAEWNYTRNNAVKAGLVTSPEEYEFYFER